jgi:hypothetical protein
LARHRLLDGFALARAAHRVGIAIAHGRRIIWKVAGRRRVPFRTRK